MKTFWKIVLISALIYFGSWLVVYFSGINRLSIQSEDTLPAMFTPVVIIKEGTLYLDSYYDLLVKNYPHPDDKSYEKGLTPFYLRKIAGHYLSMFPIMSGILALPVYFLPVLLGIPITLTSVTFLAHITSALIVSFSGGFLYLLINKHFSHDEKLSRILVVIYLFATVNYAMISQALWQHGTAQFFVILGLYFLYEKKFFLTNVALGFALISRPTSAILVFFLALLFISKKPKPQDWVRALSGFLPAVLFFLWYNNKYYIDITNQGYASEYLTGWKSRFPEGFLGMWISPSKGILIYSPVFIFSFLGFWSMLKEKNIEKNFAYIIFGAIILAHTLVVSRWKHWYGGWSFGYRMSSDMIPFMVLLLVPYLKSKVFLVTKKFFYAAIAFSIGVELFGLVFFDGIWHAAYDDGFVNTKWLWSIKNSELVFNLRRILVKIGLLDKACPQCL